MKDLYDYRPDSARGKAYSIRGGAGKIDNAALDEGPAVVNANNHGSVRIPTRDAHYAVEGKRAMRGGELVCIKDLAVGRKPPLKFPPVPGGNALLDGESGSLDACAARRRLIGAVGVHKGCRGENHEEGGKNDTERFLHLIRPIGRDEL